MKISNIIKIIMFLFIPAISLAQPYGYTGPSGGGAGSGANTALSNLISTSVNSSLNPGADSTLSLGTSILRWNTLNAEQIVLTSDFMDTMTIDADSMTSDVSLTITGVGLNLNSGNTDLTITTTGGSGIISLNTQAGGEININSDTLGFIDNTATQVDVYVARKTGGGAGIPLVISGSGATNGDTDANGGNITIASGRSTGTGTSDILFNTPTPQGGTNTTDNIPSTKFRVNGTGKAIFGSGAATAFWDPTNTTFQVGGTDYSFGPATTILPGNILSYDVAGNYATLGLTGEIVQIQGNGSLTGYAEITSLDDFRVNTTDGMVVGVNGTVSLPSIRTNDTNSGIWTPASDSLAVSVGAAERYRARLTASSGTGRNEFNAGTLSVANEYALVSTATAQTSATASVANAFLTTGNGNAAGQQYSIFSNIGAGYTGSSATYGGFFSNSTAGTAGAGVNWFTVVGSVGIQANSTGNVQGVSLGMAAVAAGANANSNNYGIFARASGAAVVNIGVIGIAIQSTTQIGGFFSTEYEAATPTFNTTPAIGVLSASLGGSRPLFVGANGASLTPVFRVEGDGRTRVLLDGAVGTPALTFGTNASADTDTGIWHPAANTLAISIAGAENTRWDSTRVTFAGPVLMTGNNASGTGTLRIRPSDEDTQIVLCEASNNSSPEMCTALNHYNVSSTQSGAQFTSNAYIDSSTAYQRYNTSAGFGTVFTGSGTTATSNTSGFAVYGTGGAAAGNVTLQASSTTASTLFLGSLGTVTTDIRGPILNGGSATCNGLWAGSLCMNEDLIMQYSSGDLVYRMQSTSASGIAYVQVLNNSNAAAGSFGYGNASYADADFAGHFWYLTNVASTPLRLGNTQDVGVTSPVVKITDNTVASGTLEGTNHVVVYGGGTVAYPSTQTITCADNAAGTNQTANLDPQAHTITILNNDATGCDITLQETSAIIGAVIIVCIDPASTATNVNFADVANVFNGNAPALSQGDCFIARYFDAANDLWLQTGISNN